MLQICTNIILNQIINVNLNHKSRRKWYQSDDGQSLGIKAGHDTGFMQIEARIRFNLWFGGDTIFDSVGDVEKTEDEGEVNALIR